MSSELFIGIPCYEEKPILQQTLQFLKQRTAGTFQFEVNVAKQSVVKNKNALLAKARASKAEYICFCDDDIEPEAGWNSSIIDAMKRLEEESGARIGQASPYIYAHDGPKFLWFNTDLCSANRDEWIDGADPDLSGVPVNQCRRIGFVGALAGTLTVFHRSFIEAMNWRFDERYERSQTEDIDQSLACRDAGLQALFVGTVEVVHHIERGRHPRASKVNLQHFIDKWRGRHDLCWPPESKSEYADFSLEMLAWREKYLRLGNKLYGSLSWRCTAPVRQAVQIARRIFSGD